MKYFELEMDMRQPTRRKIIRKDHDFGQKKTYFAFLSLVFAE